jgi:hypothetical protein
MDKQMEQTILALLAKEGLEPRDGDLERFGPLLDQYLATLKTLNSLDLADEEIAGTFHPESK